MTDVPRRPEMPIMGFLGIQIDVPTPADVYAAALEATPNTLNVDGVVHGAAIAALVDHAAGYGAMKLLGRRGVTSDLHLRYLAAARAGSVLTAEARVVRAGRAQTTEAGSSRSPTSPSRRRTGPRPRHPRRRANSLGGRPGIWTLQSRRSLRRW